jgi:hypothetical protein
MPQSGADFTVPEDVLDHRAVAVPMLHRGGVVRGGHLEVRQHEAVAQFTDGLTHNTRAYQQAEQAISHALKGIY